MHRALAFAGWGLIVALLAGLLWRGKAAQAAAFSIYVGVNAAFGCVILASPGSYTPEMFMVKQGIYDSLLFAMAIEIAFKVFSNFAGVARKVRGLLAGAVVVSTSAILLVTPRSLDYSHLSAFQPAVTTAGIWCLAFVATLIVWYQIPVPPFTRAVILGYVPYLVVFVICADLLGRLGWGVVREINIMNAIAYDVVAGYWAYAAWRKDPVAA